MAMVEGGSSFSGYERHCCFLNTGGTRFADISAASGLDFLDDGRAMGLLDWDGDGDVDAWTANRTAPRLRFLRNENPRSGDFVMLSLEGKTCNRDGIGARVRLRMSGKQPRTLIRTRRAGEGFISQTSKWIHFGLGSESSIDELSVRWPSGETEKFSGLAVNGRFRLVQGSGVAKSVPAPSTTAALVASTPKVAEETDAARIPFIFRVPLPRLNFTSFDGQSLRWKSQRPFVLNLWASWCMPCVAELKEFTEKHALIKEAGIDVVALSVETLPGVSGSANAARELSKRLSLPFQTGTVQEEFYDQLALVYGSVFLDQRPLPVPMTFLVDGDGWITVAYRGAVPVDTLISDRKLCDLSPEDFLKATAPFEGRWRHAPLPPSLILGNLGWCATALEIGGYFDESLEYWKGYFDYYKKVPRPTDPTERSRWDNELIQLLTKESAPLFVRGKRLEDALRGCEMALELRPNFAQAALNRADLLEKLGRPHDALAAYRPLIRHPTFGRPASIRLLFLLSSHPDASVRNGKEALQFAGRICEATQFKDPELVDVFAAAQAELGQFQEALRAMEQALSLARASGRQDLMPLFQARQQLYRNRQPYRLTPGQ